MADGDLTGIGTAIGGVGSLGGGIFSYLNAKQAQDDAEWEQQQLKQALAKVQDPNFDMSQFTPQEYQLVGKYAPQLIPTINEKAPQLVQNSASGQVGSDAMQSVLQRLMQVGRSGTDPQSEALIAQAQRQAQIQNQGQQGQILDNAARRGIGSNSGLALASMLSAQQGANQSAANSGTNAALDQYKNKLQALMQGGNLGNQIQQSDFQRQNANAGIINNFNARMAANNQNLATLNTNNVNDAQRMNLQNNQGLSNANTELRNNAVAQKNQNQQLQYQNALDKLRIQSGQTAQQQQLGYQGAAQQNTAVQGLTGALAAGGQYFDKMQQQPEDDLTQPQKTNKYYQNGYQV